MDTYKARVTLSLSMFAAAVLVGCANDELPPISANDRFEADNAPRAVDTIFAQQRANGAREDGTLYPQHFTAGKLNSLGYAKLSAMTHGPASEEKLAIYLDVSKDGFWAAQDSVMKAMARGGFGDDAYAVVSGPNPNVGAPAAKSLRSLSKQVGGRSDDSASPDTAVINPIDK